MNATQRQCIIRRDGFTCQNCKGTCGICNLLPPSTKDYFAREADRHPLGRLQVDHLIGRSQKGVETTEAYHHVWTLCPCCHAKKGTAMKQKGLIYAKQFEGKEPQEYLEALASEQLAFEKRKKKGKATRKASRIKAKAAQKPAPKVKNAWGKAKKTRSTSKWDAFPKLHSQFYNPD